MEQEQIIKSYDPVIMRRLLGFLKPYKAIISVAVIALLISTVAELLLPVILQRTLDNYVLVSWRRLAMDSSGETPLLPEDVRESGTRIGDFFYLPNHSLDTLSGVDKQELTQRGLLSREEFYLFPLPAPEDPAYSLIQQYSGVILRNDAFGVMRQETLAELSREEQRFLKAPYIEKLNAMTLLFFLALLGVFIFTFLQIYLMAQTGQNVMRDIRLKLFDHITHQSLSFMGNNPVGKMVNRLTNDVETINELFTSVVTSLLKDFSLMIGVIVTLFLLNARLGFITFLTLPPVLIVTLVFRKHARDAFRKVRLWVSRVNSFLSEHISGMTVVQAFGREKLSEKEFKEQNRKLMHANLGEMYVFATFRPIIDFLSSLSLAVILYFGARYYLADLLSLGVLIAFLNLIRKFYQPVMDIAEKYTILQSAMAGGERVFHMLDQKERIEDSGTRNIPRDFRGEIIFDHVHFSYKEDEAVLRDLSFRIRPGETVAVVGYTGAGKTTIANLITRLWDVQKGRILLDGTDIREFRLHELRRTVQPVQQDVFVFTGTISENISLGSEIPDDQVRKAADIVQADHFISRLPDGYNTLLTEGGTNISTGQRQLLSFARLIAHNPKIIIMDEATGSIDTETEKLIQSGIDHLTTGRTSLIIAHRLSTIKHADRILVMARGRIVEEGSHENLIKKQGVYYNLYKLQYEQTSVTE